MGKDYYQILGISKDATQPEIASQFRILAIQNHPEKNKENGRLAISTFIFSEICEAYEVLSTNELKQIYDKYGEEQMKSGIPDKKYGFKGGYKFLGNSFEIFEKFFGTSNPFTIALEEHGLEIGNQGKALQNNQYKRYQNLEVVCKCTLEEFFFGSQKQISFERLDIMADEKHQKISIVQKIIIIKPGMSQETKLIFKGEGNLIPDSKRSDLVVILEQIPNKKFQRVGDDLILEHKVSLCDSLNSKPVLFTTIDKEAFELSLDSVISPDYVKIIEEKGMPIYNDDPLMPIKRDFKRGKLILKFDIIFPQELQEKQKNELIQILNDIDEEYKATYVH